MAGLSLTAVFIWTGRLPISGSPLMALTGEWLRGEAAIDLAFSMVLATEFGDENVPGATGVASLSLVFTASFHSVTRSSPGGPAALCEAGSKTLGARCTQM